MTRDEFLDLLERIFMPLTYAQRKRMTPEIDSFVASMDRFRSGAPQGPPPDRPCEPPHAGTSAANRGFTALQIVVAVWVSFVSAGSGCHVAAPPPREATIASIDEDDDLDDRVHSDRLALEALQFTRGRDGYGSEIQQRCPHADRSVRADVASYGQRGRVEDPRRNLRVACAPGSLRHGNLAQHLDGAGR